MAIYTDNEREIPTVSKFLEHFSMGWRIYDDLNDWRKDLKARNWNHSSVLFYASHNAGGTVDLSEEIVLGMFLSTDFIKEIYGALLGFLRAARKDASALNCPYLSKFMDEQVSFHTRRRDILLRSNLEFYEQLGNILGK